jgi:rare lipoprotein A
MVNDGIVPVKLSLLCQQAVEYVRGQYNKVPRDIRLRSFQPVIAFKRDEKKLMKLEMKVY